MIFSFGDVPGICADSVDRVDVQPYPASIFCFLDCSTLFVLKSVEKPSIPEDAKIEYKSLIQGVNGGNTQ